MFLSQKIQTINKLSVWDGYLSVPCRTDGELLWKFQTYSTRLSTPIIENGIVLVEANDGYVYALQETNGNLLWRTFVSQTLRGKLVKMQGDRKGLPVAPEA